MQHKYAYVVVHAYTGLFIRAVTLNKLRVTFLYDTRMIRACYACRICVSYAKKVRIYAFGTRYIQ